MCSLCRLKLGHARLWDCVKLYVYRESRHMAVVSLYLSERLEFYTEI